MLKFLGSGSAFNTKLGNNSAYYKHVDSMLLIDCGSNIFQRIKENNVLEGINKVHTIITHTHADHVGSLADLILYTYYSHGEFAKPKVIVYAMRNIKVDELLKLNGCVEGEHYIYVGMVDELDSYKISELSIEFYFFEQSHVDEIQCYGVEMSVNDEAWIHYSSDSNKLSELTLGFINKELKEHNDSYYIDTCGADYEGNVHLSLRELSELVPQKYRHKVWCMHLDGVFDRQKAEELGFNVVVNEFE